MLRPQINAEPLLKIPTRNSVLGLITVPVNALQTRGTLSVVPSIQLNFYRGIQGNLTSTPKDLSAKLLLLKYK